MKTTSTQSHDIESVYALLAITSQPSGTPSTCCPSDAELAAFMSGELDGAARQRIFQHLRECPDCYALWQMSEACLPMAELEKPALETTMNASCAALKAVCEPEPQAQPSPTQPVVDKWSWLTQVKDWLTAPTPQLAWALSVLALVLSVPLLLPLWESELSVPQRLDNSYQHVAADNAVTVAAGLLDFTAHAAADNATSFSFAPDSGQTAAQQAFVAGLQDGQAILLQKVGLERGSWTPSSGTEDYYELGRWLILVWAVAHSLDSGSSAFWEAQQGLLADLQVRLATDVELQRALARVAEALAELPNPQQPVAYDRFAREVQFVMQSY